MHIQLKKVFLAIVLCAFVISDLSAQCTETNSGGINASTSSTSFGQSFRATCDGQLNTIAVTGYLNTSGHTVTVYQGLGVGGTNLGSLSSQSVTMVADGADFTATVFDFSSENINLTNGSDYTFVVSGTVPLRYYTSDTYADGQLFFNGSFISGFDINFDIELSAPLPVQWTSHPEVEQTGSMARITFAVAQQINNSHFEVEHSLDGTHYEAIGQIAGDKNSSAEKTYTFDHPSPHDGNNYYRIKQVDFDGNYSYSNVTTVSFRTEQINVYPNPVKDMLWLDAPEIGQVTIFNMLGHQLKSQSLQRGSNQIDISDLPRGAYLLKFKDGQLKRILIQ
ncbi:MAG: T9SS type A sorting domain-containing protein [Bacteroidota bacterium]